MGKVEEGMTRLDPNQTKQTHKKNNQEAATPSHKAPRQVNDKPNQGRHAVYAKATITPR